MINRIVSGKVAELLYQGKVIVIYGARQTGKTTLVESILKTAQHRVLFLNGDLSETREILLNASLARIKNIISDYKIISIDEAQRINDIGLILKIIHDNFKDAVVIATGSSSFDLANKLNEPLTGRKYVVNLYPLSFEEIVSYTNLVEEISQRNQRIIFGSYPEIVTSPGKETELLNLLAESYLYKDILKLENIRKPVLINKILKALALQIGNEVYYNEIAQLTGADRNTVEKYIDILEKAFVIFQVPAYSKNVRNEIKKSRKIYFYDNGIRNAVINNFNKAEDRMDTGYLWENYIVSERMKYLINHSLNRNLYFWRTTQHQEIDLIEEDGEKISAYEIKYNKKAKIRIPKTFTTSYPNAKTFLITPDNYDSILL
ncbi:MAG: ATP-binding protein [Ignavibacteriae bacterium]|nr:ATP-binding protein [Ignavibacteriota bacterium]